MATTEIDVTPDHHHVVANFDLEGRITRSQSIMHMCFSESVLTRTQPPSSLDSIPERSFTVSCVKLFSEPKIHFCSLYHNFACSPPLSSRFF